MSLSRSREHDFPSDERPVECRRCGFVLRPGMEERDLCSGLSQRGGGLQRTPLSPVSDSNSEGVVTGTELADWVRDQPCLLSGHPDHKCSPQADVIAHHVRSRGSGHGDWVVTSDGRAVGNIIPLDQLAHQKLHRVGRTTFEKEYSVDLEHAARRYGEEFPGEPPQQVRDRAQLREGI